MSEPVPERAYSNAFDRLVSLDDTNEDIVGLLAYALYKRDKRDLARSGDLDPDHIRNHHKTLTPGLLSQYRESALRHLESYSADVVLSAKPEIEEEARIESILAAQNRVIEVVMERTSGGMAVVLNVVAWLISLAITFLVAFSSGYLKLSFPVQ